MPSPSSRSAGAPGAAARPAEVRRLGRLHASVDAATMPLPTDDVAMKPETTFRPASEPAADAPEAAAEHAHAHVRRGPSARLPTEHGDFTISSYFDRSTGIEHMAIHCGELAGAREVLVRVHSECLTGDIFGSLRCDCGPQLRLALQRISQAGRGVVIYMRGHEGRGIGIDEKLRAYTLQDQGLDTVEANLALGHAPDSRRFEAAAEILQDLGVASVSLMSNNPIKLLALQQQGLEVVQREPHEIDANPENAAYLATKREKMGHLLALSSSPGSSPASRSRR